MMHISDNAMRPDGDHRVASARCMANCTADGPVAIGLCYRGRLELLLGDAGKFQVGARCSSLSRVS